MDKIYYTKKEVLEQVSIYEKEFSIEISQEPVEIEGFECIFNFCRLERGWVNAGMDYSSYSVAYAVKKWGTKRDKIKFNESTSLSEEYLCPLTRKEEALDRKRIVKRKTRKIKSNRGRIDAKDLRSTFAEYKKFGIPVFGRGKKTLSDEVFSFISMNLKGVEVCGVGHVFVKGLKEMKTFPMVSSMDELKSAIQREIETQKVKYGINPRFDPSNIKNIEFT